MKTFVNLSNHHSSKWSEEQLKTAKEMGTIVDMAYPNIDPKDSFEKVVKTALGYVRNIENIGKETIVHTMGEATFNYTIVNMLLLKGYKVVASTTERVTEELEDGKKISTFKFVQFRGYGS